MKFANMTLGQIASNYQDASDIFIKYGIDYCCGGKRNFTEACRSHGLDPDTVGKEIIEHESPSRKLDDKLDNFSIPQIISHILEYHHAYVRSKREKLTLLAKKVAAVHSERHPELVGVAQLTENLFDELEVHMRKEEEVLFPAILALVSHQEDGTPIPQTRFGSIANPIGAMERDHMQTGGELFDLKGMTDDFRVPEEGCISFKELYDGLRDMQANTFEHVHLENNVLFPRALALEQTIRLQG